MRESTPKRRLLPVALGFALLVMVLSAVGANNLQLRDVKLAVTYCREHNITAKEDWDRKYAEFTAHSHPYVLALHSLVFGGLGGSLLLIWKLYQHDRHQSPIA
jgi:hypothetical protein